jgi:hypothetical protein
MKTDKNEFRKESNVYLGIKLNFSFESTIGGSLKAKSSMPTNM